MRRLIVSNMMSLDGYYEGPGKNVMALFDYRWEREISHLNSAIEKVVISDTLTSEETDP
jgi:hypothetical protein